MEWPWLSGSDPGWLDLCGIERSLQDAGYGHTRMRWVPSPFTLTWGRGDFVK